MPAVDDQEQASFSLPTIQDNPVGWGPSQIPFSLTQIPYAPFSKSDRLGKIADWTMPIDAAAASGPGGAGADAGAAQSRTRRNFRGVGAEAFGTGTASAFAFSFSAEEEASFSVVDRASTTKRTGGGGFRLSRGGPRLGGGQRGGMGNAAGNRGFAGSRGFGNRGGMAGRRRYGGYNDKPQRIRDASVQVGPEWVVKEEIDFSRLNKLYYEVEDPEDISTHGTLQYYDKAFDRVSTKFERPLQQIDRTFVNVTTSNDPVILELSKDISGPAVFATDNVLSTLMCAARSVYSWDIVIQKNGDKLFFDKREGGNFDFFTVNENAAEPPMEGGDKDGPNTPVALAQESTYILRNYSQQILKPSERYQFQNPNPFEDSATETEPLPSVAYRYRKWNLGNDINLIVRASIDAAIHAPGAQSSQGSEEEAMEPEASTYPASETLFVISKVLNEFDSRATGAGGAPDWRQKLDAQRGAVMATEIKNNGNKLARWTTEALLAGVDQIRIGFASRVNPKERLRHSVLGTAFFKPKEFAVQMNLAIENGWGILKTFVDLLLKMEDGKYVMVKDPNKSMLRLYSVPANTFEDEEEEGNE
ncbi:Eukaryotic translation initiation factor 3 subunit D [Phlyctochytrium planicorne]|nr:Eukaryotic translation initiation factor 3 subunit D [Phlyctochytrium planicorne]